MDIEQGSEQSVAVQVPRSTVQEGARQALPGSPWEQRRRELHKIFARIEPHYDRLNRILSLGLDRGWREWTAHSIEVEGPWLDLASGTGDLAAHLFRRAHLARSKPILIRSDLVPALLPVGFRKLGDAPDDHLARPAGDRGDDRPGGAGDPDCPGSTGDPAGQPASRRSARADDSPGLGCEMDLLPFANDSLGAIVQGFALRHCRDYAGFFAELHRVLRPGGQIAILDMRYPKGPGTGVYRAYFRFVLPRIAMLLGGDRDAYRFLVKSVRSMPEEEVFLAALRDAGFERVESRPGFLGSVRLLLARKPGALAGTGRSAYSAESA